MTDAQLRREAIQLIGLGRGHISYFDAQRALQQGSLDALVSLDFQREGVQTPSLADPGLLVLTSGEILRGSFAGVSEKGLIQWDSPVLGRVSYPLDKISRFTVAAHPPAVPDEAASDQDRVVLGNGDVVRGFVQAATAAGLTVQRDAGEVTLPWDRVGRVVLGAAVKSEPGDWVRLVSGSKLRVTQASYQEQKFTAVAADSGKRLEMPGSDVAGLDFAERHRLIRLADLPRTVVSGGTVFGVPMPPRATADGLWLHAPVTVRVELPAGSVRFAADAALDPQSLDWADLTLKLSTAKGPLGREHLDAKKPTARVNVPLSGSTLTIELDEGANGPVRDRLTLNHAAVLVSAP